MPVKTHFCSNLLEAVSATRVTVRSWRSDDIGEINALFNDPSVRPGAAEAPPRTDAQWEWEFDSTPQTAPAYYVAEQSGRIIGLQGYIPIDLLHNGRLVRSGKDEDTLVHPDHRGRGVLDSMYQRLFEQASKDRIVALWGFTSTAVQPLLRNGYRSIGIFDALEVKLGPPSQPMKGCDPVMDDVVFHTLAKPDDRLDAFSFAFGHHAGGITLHLSVSYLRWRIFENPYRRHVLIAAFHNQDIVGIGAFKLDDPNRIGYVSELAAVPAGSHRVEDILSALIREGLAIFRKLGLRTAEARFSGPHPYNVKVCSVLAQWGFRSKSNSKAAEFLVRPILGDSPDCLNLRSWRICELMREY